ncbi:ubiquitin carboxyl-terminal hydrolase 8-like isoform X1 [Canna indica]|uniref:Ubiquitin carboxyl-terminal hydrolase n=1 Tax=Canna indica TaxID=4628 RepID=A0AAQ3KVC4_9LILI|nr:ubiquitin carboxyl-terminal hydrolase 8-like isoform X1 [Canna indica]
MDESPAEAPSPADPSPPASDADASVYLVPYRWWREAQDPQTDNGPRGVPYAACHTSTSYGMKIISNIFSSDLVFNLRKDDGLGEEDEEGSRVRSYALIGSDLWSQALKRHDTDLTANKDGTSLFNEDKTSDVYPLMLRISVMRETNIFVVKISKKDNAVENYKRASKIFGVDSEPVCIWDFSGRTNLILMDEWNRVPQDCHQKSDQEVLLEVQVSALLEVFICKSESRNGDLALDQSKMTASSSGELLCNGSLGIVDQDFQNENFKGGGLFGLRGLENLGNTCFMNSALQCLAHTPKLVDYFHGNYRREINLHNPLGLKGELALAFGDLLRSLWEVERSPVFPRVFKAKLGRFAPQFSGFNQHDSQELLAFLLDGLHEDLNRVKNKPYVEAKDASGRPDEEVADEYWGNHLARNDSIIVDICQGQYKSTLVCPVCSKVSITFDPFMYLSLPLPSTTMRTMTITVFSTDDSMEPSTYTITVPKSGKLKDLIRALSIASSLRNDESLLIAEVYANCIIRFLEDPLDSISLIRDEDRLAAYRLSKDAEKAPLVVFVHQRLEEYYLGKRTNWKGFGIPLVTMLPDFVDGSTIRKLFLKVLNPFKKNDTELGDCQDKCSSISADAEINMVVDSEFMAEEMEGNAETEDDLQFYLTDEKGKIMQSKIEMNEPVSLPASQKHLHVLVCWQSKALEQYNIDLLNTLPEVYKFRLFPKRSQDSCTLYACLEAFLKEEPLGPEDMWYCPSCKKHQQATKKLDLWRLPEVLVIHLKRFSYTRYTKNKLETLVDFPIHDLDLSMYVAGMPKQITNKYRLYAVSNHYGNMGGGHYTAYVYHERENRWYDFDDRSVIPISEESIKTSAAYVLFYKRT